MSAGRVPTKDNFGFEFEPSLRERLKPRWGGYEVQRYVRTRSLGIFLARRSRQLLCGPWFAKNLVLTGNPTYPLLYRMFDGRTRTAEKDAQWRRAHEPPNFSPVDLLDRATGFALTSDWLNPLVIPLAALALVCRPRRQLVRWLGAYMLFVLGVWWLCTHRLDRFWVPVLPVAALLAGIGATWSTRPQWRWILGVWLVVGLV